MVMLLFLCIQAFLISASTATTTSNTQLVTTECVYNKTIHFMLCNTSAGNDGCNATMHGIASNFSLFSIGETKATGGEAPLVWFRIYPRKEDNSGWWYYKGAKNTHSKLLIHPKEKHSKSNEGFLVQDNICWAKLHEMIRSSKSIDTIKAEKFNKGLFSSPYEKIKTIGTLKVVD